MIDSSVADPTPSLGAVVRMRGRLWRVDRVEGDVFAATPLDGRDAMSRRFSAVLEQIEPGTTPYPDSSSVGSPADQRLLLDAYRLSLVHGTAPILGLQRSRAVPTEYQLVPLLKSLGQDRVRMLIADGVGTGKTIEAGLILAELLARGKVRRVLVAVPANLRDQWADDLEHFFHLSPTVIAGHLLPALERTLLPGQSVWAAHDVVVASIDYLKLRPETVLSHPWDLLLIDEAHLVARPHRLDAGESDMQRWQFARRAAQVAPYLLLLTATPHNGHQDSYASLFELLDPSLVTERQGEPKIARERARDHVVQRRRQDLERWYESHGGSSPFPRRDQDELVISGLSIPLQEMLKAVAVYSGRLYQGVDARHINSWIAAHLQKRALSSPEALRKSLRTRMGTLRRQGAVAATARSVRDAKEHVADTLYAEDASDEVRSGHVDVAASALDAQVELGLLITAQERAEAVTAARDTKLQRLIELLAGGPAARGRLDAHPQRRRVIVFTRFRDTLDYLVRELRRDASRKTSSLPPDLTVFSIYGEMTLHQRREEFARFERTQPAVLVATDCISEGLNLQRHCAELVHYELPWNPNRLEQRNGRIDRYGQPEPFVGIRLLVQDDPLDHVLAEKIVAKARAMYEQYGFVPNFLANPDILHFLSRSAGRAAVRQQTLFEAAAEEEVTDAVIADPFDPATAEMVVQQSFYGQEGVSLGAVQEALDASRAAVGGPDRLATFLDLALAEYGIRREPAGSTVWRLSGSHSDLADLTATPKQEYTLDPGVGFGDPEVDVVDLSHPLIRRLVDLLRDRANLREHPGRVAALHTPDVERVIALIHVLARYVAASDPPVLLEELMPVAVPVYGDGTVPAPESLLNPRAGFGTRTNAEIVEDAQLLLGRVDLAPRLTAEVESHRSRLASAHGELDASWARGLEQLETASSDLLTITLLYPEAR